MYTMDEFIAHHGILGQRWGIRRYQNKDGSLTAAGRKHWDQLDRKTKAKIKDNMIRSSNIKVLQAHQKYLTPNEIRKATERLAVNKTISDFKEEEIQRGMQRIANLGAKAKQVGDTVSNISDAYNSIAKVINSVSDKNLPIIGEKKEIKPRDFSLKDLSKTDLTKLKGEELKNAMNTMLNYNKMDKNIREYNSRVTNDFSQRKKLEQANADAYRKANEKAREENAKMVYDKKVEEFNRYQQQMAYKKAKGEKTEVNPKKENNTSENKSTFLLTGPTTKDNNSLSLPDKSSNVKALPDKSSNVKALPDKSSNVKALPDKSSNVKALPDKSSNTILALPGPVKTETTKSYSAFKEHYTSDDISSARNYVMSNFGNVSYNNIGDYRYSNPSFSAQYNKMTERNNNRNPYYVSHKDLEGEELFHYGVKGMKWDESKKKTEEESVAERKRKRLSSLNRDNFKKGVVTSTLSDDAMDFAYNSANKLTNGELDKRMEKLSQKFNNYLNKKLDDAEKTLNKIGEKAENSIYNSMKDKDLADFYKRLIST